MSVNVDKHSNQNNKANVEQVISLVPNEDIQEETYDYGNMNDTMENYDVVTDRNTLIVNNHVFKLKPVKLKDSTEFSELLYAIIALEGEKKADKNNQNVLLSMRLTYMFSSEQNQLIELYKKPLPKINWYGKNIFKDHNYYCQNSMSYQFAKWIEKTVEYNGKKVTLYQLENKFELTKWEIANLLIAITKLSGFM